jgi:hypothetical protein
MTTPTDATEAAIVARERERYEGEHEAFRLCMEQLIDATARIEALTSALGRVLLRFRQMGHVPVRDMAETIAEAEAALATLDKQV